MKPKLKNKAFTLIELLAVVVIIGILMATVTLALNDARKSARDTRRRADLRQLATAVEFYASDYNQYPEITTLKNIWSASPDEPDSPQPGSLADQLIQVGAMKIVPQDPLYPKRVYKYRSDAGGSKYYFETSLEKPDEFYYVGYYGYDF